MAKPDTDPPIADTVPWADRMTEYDEQHLATYLRLLDAEEDGADPAEMARIILGIFQARLGLGVPAPEPRVPEGEKEAEAKPDDDRQPGPRLQGGHPVQGSAFSGGLGRLLLRRSREDGAGRHRVLAAARLPFRRIRRSPGGSVKNLGKDPASFRRRSGQIACVSSCRHSTGRSPAPATETSPPMSSGLAPRTGRTCEDMRKTGPAMPSVAGALSWTADTAVCFDKARD